MKLPLWRIATLFCFLLPISTVVSAKPAIWQWSLLLKNAREGNGQARAFLWIPPNCKQVRAIIVAQNNMEEQPIFENPLFRREMGRLGIAEVWVSPSFDHVFDFTKGAGATFTDLMNDLANLSGYEELAYVPFIGLGHSAAASAPYYMAAWNPGRALAAISVSGQWPYFRHPLYAPDIWEDRNLDGIPCLETMGEYEAADSFSKGGLKERSDHPLMPLSMLANPAQGHFATTDEKCAYLALYLKKVLQYRLPARAAVHQAPKLIKIDPGKTGWLAERWRYNQLPSVNPAPVGVYKGDPSQAFWFFDEEMARATISYQARHRQQQPQLIGYVQNGKMVAQRNTHQQVNLKFEPETDGITFRLKAAFYDTVVAGSPRLPLWTNLEVGRPIGHAKGGGPISIDRITGPVIKLDDSTFQVHPQAGFWQSPHSYELWFAATHPGDADYKPAVQQSQMMVPPLNLAGQEQHIAFDSIPDHPLRRKVINLIASSDAGVPVYFYVLEGPVTLKGNQLMLSALPPRSRFPVKVTVVAWQYGNSRTPQLKTAASVARTFRIFK